MYIPVKTVSNLPNTIFITERDHNMDNIRKFCDSLASFSFSDAYDENHFNKAFTTFTMIQCYTSFYVFLF